MSQPLTVSLPPNLQLSDGYIVRATALDPVTGATMTGVTIDSWTLQVEVVSGNPADLQFGPFMLVPGPGA